MGICFGIALFHLLSRFVKILNFTNSWRWISRFGLDACFGMGGCLCSLVLIWVLFGLRIFLRVLAICWRVLLGSYSAAPLLDWRLTVGFDAEAAAFQVAQEPDVWTDGSRIEDRLSTVSSSDAGFSSGHSSRFWAGRSWRHVDDDDQGNQAVASCRGYCSVPGPLQTVQRAELWGVILALQASRGVHLGGVDNLNVVRHVGRMLDGNLGTLPFSGYS